MKRYIAIALALSLLLNVFVIYINQNILSGSKVTVVTEKNLKPYYFVLMNNGLCFSVFIPNPQMTTLTERYLKLISSSFVSVPKAIMHQ